MFLIMTMVYLHHIGRQRNDLERVAHQHDESLPVVIVKLRSVGSLLVLVFVFLLVLLRLFFKLVVAFLFLFLVRLLVVVIGRVGSQVGRGTASRPQVRCPDRCDYRNLGRAPASYQGRVSSWTRRVRAAGGRARRRRNGCEFSKVFSIFLGFLRFFSPPTFPLFLSLYILLFPFFFFFNLPFVAVKESKFRRLHRMPFRLKE